MNKFTATCYASGGDYLCSVWLECDENVVKQYSKELCFHLFDEASVFQLLPGHLSQEEVGVHFPEEWTLEDSTKVHCNPEFDKPEEWFLERGYVSSFGCI